MRPGAPPGSSSHAPSLVTALVTATLCGACAPDSSLAVSHRRQLLVEVMLEPSQLRLVTIDDASARALHPASGARQLEYRLVGDDGAALAHGTVDDPRVWRSEWIEDGGFAGDESSVDFGLLTMHLPATDGDLIIAEPTSDGPMELGRIRFEPGTGKRQSALGSQASVVGPPTRMRGEAASGIDIFILAEGYTKEQLPAFHAAAQDLADDFLLQPGIAEHDSVFNLWRVDVVSQQSGADDPDAHIEVDTAFDVTFDKGEVHRRATSSPKGIELARSIAGAAAEVIVLLVNHSAHGGSGSGNFIVTTANDGTLTAPVLAHEFGHAALGLADEYDQGPCDKKKKAPNVSKSAERDKLPWADLVLQSTPLPTPQGTPGVGAFEGANYCEHGMWRPAHDCLMRALDKPLCPVCARELDRKVAGLTSGTGQGATQPAPAPPSGDACPPEWADDGVCDPCLGDDPDCSGW